MIDPALVEVFRRARREYGAFGTLSAETLVEYDEAVAALAQAPAAPPTCATCQYWRLARGEDLSQPNLRLGFCEHDRFPRTIPSEPLTRADFGCALHDVALRPASAATREAGTGSGVITSGLRLTNEEDSKALWLTRRLMPTLEAAASPDPCRHEAIRAAWQTEREDMAGLMNALLERQKGGA